PRYSASNCSDPELMRTPPIFSRVLPSGQAHSRAGASQAGPLNLGDRAKPRQASIEYGLEPFRPAQDETTLVDVENAVAAPDLNLLVDGFSRRIDHGAELTLGETQI